MKQLSFYLAILLVVFVSSCINQKYIFPNNTIGKRTSVPFTTKNEDGQDIVTIKDFITLYNVEEGFISNIKIDGNIIIIEGAGNRLSLIETFETTSSINTDKLFYTDLKSESFKNKFRYFDSKPLLQALAIPIKIRPRLDDSALLDSFPSQTETGFNPALAFGLKMSFNNFRINNDIFGRNLRQLSLTPGFFFGTGATDLKKTNTRNPIIKFERKATVISPGMFLMFGYNNINFGYSLGIDFATGKGSQEWLYQGLVWHGISLGLDILK
ncbi:MAG TPA: hypothetical protein VFG10_09780 [Saprospiraceae bacterium]|nr:hypothetical protein [Saprospiraceae bacterium]